MMACSTWTETYFDTLLIEEVPQGDEMIAQRLWGVLYSQIAEVKKSYVHLLTPTVTCSQGRPPTGNLRRSPLVVLLSISRARARELRALLSSILWPPWLCALPCLHTLLHRHRDLAAARWHQWNGLEHQKAPTDQAAEQPAD